MGSSKVIRFGSLVLFAIILTACRSTPSGTVAEPVVVSPGESTQTLSIQYTATPASTATPTTAASATSTTVPSATPTSTPTAIPWSQAIIGLENLDQVAELNQWGNGSIQKMISIHQGSMVVIKTFLGIYVYKLDPWSLVWMAKDSFPVDRQVHLAISPDESLLAVEYPNFEVRTFEIESGKQFQTFQHEFGPKPPRDPGWSDSTYEWILSRFQSMTSITFSPGSDLLAVGFGDAIVDVWDVRSGNSVARLTKDIAPLPYEIAFAHNKKWLISSDGGNSLIWDLSNQTPIIRIPNAGQLNASAFSPDDSKYLTVVGLYILVYEVPSGTFLYKYGVGLSIKDLFFSEDGTQLIVQTVNGYQVRDLASGKLVPNATWQPGAVSYPSPDEILSAGFYSNLQGVTALDNEDILAWGEETNPYFLILPAQVPRMVNREVELQSEFVTSPDGKRFAYCAHDQLWSGEVASLSSKTIYPCNDKTHLAISNEWIAWGMDTTLRAIDPNNGTVRTNFIGHVRAISMLSFTLDGKYLMSGSTDPDAKRYVDFWVWLLDPSQGVMKIQDIPDTVIASTLSPDGCIAAFGYLSYSGTPVRVVDVSSGNSLALLGGINTTAMSFSPDGRLLVVGDLNGSISFYSRDSWKKVSTLTDHQVAIKGLIFSPDGKNLISFSQADGTIRVWGIGEK